MYAAKGGPDYLERECCLEMVQFLVNEKAADVNAKGKVQLHRDSPICKAISRAILTATASVTRTHRLRAQQGPEAYAQGRVGRHVRH